MYSATTSSGSRLPLQDCSELNALSQHVGWDVDYTQLHAGDLDGSFEFSVTETLRIGSPVTHQSMIAHGTPPRDCAALLIPLTPGARGTFQGQEFGKGQVGIMCPGSEAYYRTPTHNQFMTVCIPTSRLRPLVEELADRSLEPLLGNSRVVPLDQHSLQQLTQGLHQAVVHSEQEDSATGSSTALAELEQCIACAVTGALMGMPEETPRRIIQRQLVFLRARDHIDSNLAAPLGLEVLAREAGVSLRTLRYSFQQLLGLNPLQYVKLRRLQAARRALLLGRKEETTVTDIALLCGFSHMGYFARDYRALCGEPPSETLRQRGANM